MIPKIIHYCWFGGKPLPEKDKKCIESWKRFCPDYEIRQWDESNYDVKKNKYMYEAYQAEKWGFVPDYARLDIIYHCGGIYLDTDVEIVKSLDELLINHAFMGFEEGRHISPGLGFGAEKGHPGIRAIMEMYNRLEFVNEDGSYNLTPSPVMNSDFLMQHGARMNNQMQEVMGITLYPSEYFCPKSYTTGELQMTPNTISIHHFNSSWMNEEELKLHRMEQNFLRKYGAGVGHGIYRTVSFPYRVKMKLKQKGIRGTVRFIIEKVQKKGEG